MEPTRYWIGVVSRSHVQRGVEGGFVQLNHGKAAPLRRMNVGDWFVYYSPHTDYPAGKPLQAFTTIGRITGDTIYQVEMDPDFIPSRRDVTFLPCQPAPIAPMLDALSFLHDRQRWGYIFRTGHFSVPEADFRRIAAAMGVDIDA